MAWIYYNPNPQGLLVGDCTIRAICAVTGFDWVTVHRMVSSLSEDMADMPSSDRVWWSLLEQFGFRLAKLIDQCPNCYTVSDFAYDHPLGDYILGPKEHAVAVINGNWYDTWDSGDMVPTYYFRRS